MSLYLDGSYQQHNPTWHVEDSPWKAGQILKMLRRNRIEPHSVVEVGCGAGAILSALAEQMPKTAIFSGYEVSEAAYQLCLQRQTERVRFYMADLLESEVPTADMLLTIDVIEHIEDVYSFLRRLRCKGNYKIFHIPLDFNLINLLRPNILANMRRQIGHLHYFTKDTALALLADTGYTLVDWFYTSGALELDSTTAKVARLNPLRRLMFPWRPDLAVRMLGGYSLLALTT